MSHTAFNYRVSGRGTALDGVALNAAPKLFLALLSAPFVLASGFVGMAVSANAGAGPLVAMTLLLAILLAPAFVLARTGRTGIVALMAACLFVPLVGALIHMGGGMVSPFMAFALFLAGEAIAIKRNRIGVLIGVIAGGLAAGLGICGFAMSLLPVQTASGWQWLPVLVYGTIMFARFESEVRFAGVQDRVPAAETTPVHGASVLMNSDGRVLGIECNDTLTGAIADLLYGRGLVDRLHVADRTVYLSALMTLRDRDEVQRASLRLRLPRAGWGHDALVSDERYYAFRAELAPGAHGGVRMTLHSDKCSRESGIPFAEKDGRQDQMIASIAHGMQGPLTAIAGYSDSLASGAHGQMANEAQIAQAAFIRDASAYVLDVMRSSEGLYLARDGQYVPSIECFDFNAALSFALKMTAGEHDPKRVAITHSVARGLSSVIGDRKGIQQILVNLIGHAALLTDDGEIRVTAYREGGSVCFTVSDTGSGMAGDADAQIGQMKTSPPIRRKTFLPSDSRTGPGLAIADLLVRAMGGTMVVKRIPKIGTMVSVRLADGAVGAPNPDQDFELHEELSDVAFQKTA